MKMKKKTNYSNLYARSVCPAGTHPALGRCALRIDTLQPTRRTFGTMRYAHPQSAKPILTTLKKLESGNEVGDNLTTYSTLNKGEGMSQNIKKYYTSYSKYTEIKLVTIGLASPLRILHWAEKTLPNGKIYGEVLNANTLHHKTFKPQKGGLFCERIFGPLKDFQCACGKRDKSTKKYNEIESLNISKQSESATETPISTNKTLNLLLKTSLGNIETTQVPSGHRVRPEGTTPEKTIVQKNNTKMRKFCPVCDVEYTWSVIRRYQLGYIKLISPVTHVWFLKGTPSYLSVLLDIKRRRLQSITYCSETLTLENANSPSLSNLSFGSGTTDLDTPAKIFATWSSTRPKETVESPSIQPSSNDNQTKLVSNLHSSHKQRVGCAKRIEAIKKYSLVSRGEKIETPNSGSISPKGSHIITRPTSTVLTNTFLSAKVPVRGNLFTNEHGRKTKLAQFICSLQLSVLLRNLTVKLGESSRRNMASVGQNNSQRYSHTEHQGTRILNRIYRSSLPVDLYILCSIERLLQKKILFISIVKAWRDVYKKAFLKALFKVRCYVVTSNNLSSPLVSKTNEVNVNYSQQLLKNIKDVSKKHLYTEQFFNKMPVGDFAKRNRHPLCALASLGDALRKIQTLKQPILSTNSYSFYGQVPFLKTRIREANRLRRAERDSSTGYSEIYPVGVSRFATYLSKRHHMYKYISPAKVFCRSTLQIINKISNEIQYTLRATMTEDQYSESIVNYISEIGFEPSLCFALRTLSPEPISQKASLALKNTVYTDLRTKLNSALRAKGKKTKRSFGTRTRLLSKQLVDDLSKTPSTKRMEILVGNPLRKENPLLTMMDSSLERNFVLVPSGRILKEEHLIRVSSGNIKSRNKRKGTETDVRYANIGLNVINKQSSYAIKKGIYNNIYTLSHRESWGGRGNEGSEKDWQLFMLYNSALTDFTDIPISAYKHRLRSSIIFSTEAFGLSSTSTGYDGKESPMGYLQTSRRDVDRTLSMTTAFNSLGTFLSGPGIVQKLLNELTFTEIKKLDKQNRLLLYQLNKLLFKLKKQVKLFVYDKTLQIEIRELCKKRDLLIRRTKLVRKLFRKNSDPSSMVLTVLPVLPPDLRPIVKMGGQIAASDLNRLYQRVIYRNDRLKKFLKDPATSHSSPSLKYAQRLLQEAVDNLIQNGKSGVGSEKDSRGRVLKSLSDILKGKQGRFRQFLLGKRVDYSGRSVIVVGPKLKLHECGIPLEMALELYLPFLLKNILNKNYARTVVGAKTLIKNNRPLAIELLRDIMQVSPVLLNRAPTLHRLGFQAFVPKLVEGRAVLLHPLVCSAFNADFDGDQMAVHVPITVEARAEAWKLMLSRNNLLSPATGDPLAIPSQDMVLGCYYLTTYSNKASLPLLRRSLPRGLRTFLFKNIQNVLFAYHQQLIELHALVWVQWSDLIEDGNDQEEPVEIRLSPTGSWHEFSSHYIRSFDSSSQLVNQYMSTTPGRILFNSLLQNLINN